MNVRFVIEDWAAYAPGLADRGDWKAWAEAPHAVEGALDARLEIMPAMQRRRLNGLGRAAAQVAWACHAPDPSVPVVFASRYGDAQRCLQLLREFAATGTASPTEFTFSVHNAIGGMYAIARGDTANSTSIAAGASTAAAGAIEAAALLADGAPQVLLVHYDAPLPGEYAGFDRETSSYAWAWRLRAARPDEAHMTLSCDGDTEEHPSQGLPCGLQALRCAVRGEGAYAAPADGRGWTWSWRD